MARIISSSLVLFHFLPKYLRLLGIYAKIDITVLMNFLSIQNSNFEQCRFYTGTCLRSDLDYLNLSSRISLKWSYSWYRFIGKHELNRRNKLILEIELSKGFAPTRLIISIFHRLIGQYFESGILFISLANLHGGKRWLDVWERRRQVPL